MKPPKKDMFEQLAQIMGEKAAEELCKAWGGLRVYVPTPQTMDALHPIALAVGLEAAIKLCKRFSGETLTIPMLDRLRRARRHHEIIEAYKAGATARALARKYGMHETTIYQLVAKLDARRQQTLFE